MLRLSRLTDYATAALGWMAERPERIVSAADIAQALHLEGSTVAKVLKSLVQAGVVESFRGATGGYRLSRPAAQINLVTIVEALEGPLGMTDCAAGAACEHALHCSVSAPWQRISAVVADTLSRMSLADLARPMARRRREEIA
ncbi:SUF system Fe-S cluster assembly regulator [Metallibacterium sp.]|uniref:SUF system Fe-S cluster assembly regulator n=1 Tax=Metallibacterium sp. TaxID=2940281 RepID=UPI00262869E8|nr:SUF system Fe-S cluster assembly regulator [Metallibacterium sp.]